MNAAKRRKLAVSRRLPVSDATVGAASFAVPGYRSLTQHSNSTTTNGLQDAMISSTVPIECNPTVPGLFTVTVRASKRYTRPSEYTAIVTYAERDERSGVADYSGDAINIRRWPLYSPRVRSVHITATFQYQGVMHNRQGRRIPFKYSNVDSLLVRFAGSIPMINSYDGELPDMHSDVEFDHSIYADSDNGRVKVGHRAVVLLNVCLSQGRFRSWLLSPGTVVQAHTIILHNDKLNEFHTKGGRSLKIITFKTDVLHLFHDATQLPWSTWTSQRNDATRSINYTDNVQVSAGVAIAVTIVAHQEHGNRNSIAFETFS